MNRFWFWLLLGFGLPWGSKDLPETESSKRNILSVDQYLTYAETIDEEVLI
jgi:hypothetical protein